MIRSFFISNCPRNENFLKFSRFESYDIHIVKKKTNWGHRTRLEDIYDKCNMPPFPQDGPISAFLGVTETIEILQPLTNFFDNDHNTNACLSILYILPYRIPLICIALVQTCLFHLLKHVSFGRMRGK